METAAQRFARFATEVDMQALPAPVRDAAQLHALDVLGCGLAAYALGEAPYAARAALEEGVSGPSTGIGVSAGMPSGQAALLNGTLCHALDFDDTHPDSVVHVSAAVVPAALAAAQAVGASGADTLAAVIAGNEVSTRVGSAAGGLFHARGFHPTGVCGVFGATVAAARVRRLPAGQLTHALGIAGSFAGGLLEFLADGSQTKRLHPGWAAQAGLAAARLAACGATGPSTVFEGARGFFATYVHGADVDLEAQLDDLGRQWRTPDIAYKPYPACHYVHAPVDSLAQILTHAPLAPEDISSITAYSDATGVGLVLEPSADKSQPRTAYDAKFSLPYCLSSMVARGRLDVASFTESAIGDATVLELSKRVRYELRQYSPAPDAFGGGVRVETVDGRTFEAELRYQRGGSQNPLSEPDVVRKFRENAELALPTDAVEALLTSVLALHEQANPGWIALLGRAGRAAA